MAFDKEAYWKRRNNTVKEKDAEGNEVEVKKPLRGQGPKPRTDGAAKPKDQEGSIKMIKHAEGNFKLQLKFGDGWVESSSTAFNLKEK